MDDFPNCQVCQQHFKLKGPSPYLLPCLHAVCETCVTSTAGGVISCSTCQGEVNLTETHLQKDVVRQREIFHLTVQHRPSELLCTHEDDGNQAVCWCQECEEFLCENCQTLHESFKATRRHAVQEIADIQPGSLDHDEYCRTHTKCLLDYWDQECNILICGRCRRGDHADHEVVDIDVAADSAKTNFVTRQKEVQQVGVHHNSLLDTTTEQLKATNETSNTLRDKICHTFHSLKALLEQREKELLIALQRRTEETKEHLDSKINDPQLSHSRCKMTSEYIQKALLYSSKYDLLKIKKTIDETTQSCIDSSPPEEQEDLPLPVFNSEGLDRLKSSLSSFGQITTLKDLSHQTQMYQDKATQAGAEYLAKLDEMENRNKMHLKQFEDDLKTSQSKVEELQTVTKGIKRQKEEAERDAKGADEACKKSIDEMKNLEKEVLTHKETIKSLESSLEDYKNKVKRLENTLDLMPDSYHLLTNSILLQCINLKFDLDRVNLRVTHIDNNGVLVNKAGKGPRGNTSGRFQKYCGTTSTVPLSQTGHPQYIEVVTDVGIDKPLEWKNLVIDLGVCREEDMDVKHQIPDQQYCYSLLVSNCPHHNSVCTNVWKDEEEVHHVSDTLPNTVGSHTTLHYGMVYDSNRKVIVFIDVKGMKTIKLLDNVICDKTLWPMFAVYARDSARISMKLVVGKDIDMTPEKKAMILQAL